MPELKQVQLYDFRRFKGTRTYKLTKSILHVQHILGHNPNDIRATMKYITLEDDTTTWIPVVCTTDEEIRKAIEDDCILVCQADGKTYFKKPA
jgi:hypothetical protein